MASILWPGASPFVCFGRCSVTRGWNRMGPLGNGSISRRGLVKLCPNGFKVEVPRGYASPPDPPKRGIITGFSASSRRRLMGRLLRSPFDAFAAAGKRASVSRAFFGSLTYPGDYPGDWEVWKAHLQAWLRRVKRAFPSFLAYLWKLEFQERGAAHFHVVLLFTQEQGVRALSQWVKGSWSEIAGSGDEWHGVYGADVRVVYGRGDKLMRYLLKYLGKTWDALEAAPPGGCGRVWGHSQDWPLEEFDTVELVGSDWVEFVRRVRRWGRRSDFLASRTILHNFTAFGWGVACYQLLRGLDGVAVDGWSHAPP